MKQALLYIGIFIVLAGITYGCYQLGKALSYSWFYEDMVRETVKEMIKPEFLKPKFGPRP